MGRLAVVGMLDGEIGGMEAESGGRGEAGCVGIQRVAQNRMPERGQMQADLVRTTGEGHHFQAGAVGVAAQHPPAGLGRTAGDRIDAIPWGPHEVAGDRQIDQPVIGRWQAPHEALVSLPHRAGFELSAEISLGVDIEGHQHEARGVAVEPVDDDGRGKCRLHTTGEAVLQQRPAARHGEQAGRLVEYDQAGVVMDDPAGVHIRHHSR